jgi:hypothetical protein
MTSLKLLAQKSLASVALMSALLAPAAVMAADVDGDCIDDDTGLDVPGCSIDSGTGAAAPDLGLGYASNIGLGTQDIRDTIALTINVAMGFLGTIAVVIILYGGFKWMTSGGEQGKVDEARKLIIAGIVGLAIILASWAIANFVVGTLLKGTGIGE